MQVNDQTQKKYSFDFEYTQVPCGLVVRIPGFHPGGPGSIPGMGVFFFIFFFVVTSFGKCQLFPEG